ncbi:MAG: helix-turn-helix domain-containing protein, partial [Pseudomonadota bacterium]
MALKAHLEQTNLVDGVTIDGRRHPRRALKLHTSGVSDAGAPANVTIHNLSAAGLLIETDLELVPGERLAIGLPDVGPVGAEIVWVSERLYGCAFDQALGEAALAASELRSEPMRTRPDEPTAPKFGKPDVGDSLGYKLNQLRRERSLTLEQVANALGVSKPTVWAWEKGKAKPLPERIAAIAEVLGVSESELLSSGQQDKSGNLVEECRLRIA